VAGDASTVQAHDLIMCMFIGGLILLVRAGEKRLLRCDRSIESKDESLGLYGQVNKRTRWMPWQPEAMKDVVGNEILGEPSNRL
jgi:hypothetical protein